MIKESFFMRFSGAEIHLNLYRSSPSPLHRAFLLSSPEMTVFHWRKLLPELEAQECLVAIAELPGFGQSTIEGNRMLSLDMLSGMLWGVLDEIDVALNSPMSLWHLFGHGSACPVLTTMAAQFPDSVKSLFLINPLFTPSVDAHAQRLNLLSRDENHFAASLATLAGRPLEAYVLDHFEKSMGRRDFPVMLSRYAKMLCASQLTEIGFCPTLVLRGGADPLAAEEDPALHAHLLEGAEMHLLRDGGHLLTETHSGAVCDYLRGWLKFNASV